MQETFSTRVLMLARHTGMSVPAALDGLAICPCATRALTALTYLCVIFGHEAVIYYGMTTRDLPLQIKG